MNAAQPAGALARWRVAIAYRWRHGRWPDLDNPRRFTEHVQWRKLNDRDEGLALLTDKLVGKRLALERIGRDAVIPTLWTGVDLPELPPAPLPLIVKSNHGCEQFIVVRTIDDWTRARSIAPGWLKRAYGIWLDEWHYRRASRMLLIEPFVGSSDTLPLDYKVFVFHGRAEIVQVHFDRASAARHRWVQFDRRWRRLSPPDGQANPQPPATLEQMLTTAETLAAGVPALRVDLYEVAGRVLFGEFCLFPGSGLLPFEPVDLDVHLGALWGVPRFRSGGSIIGTAALGT